MAQKKMLDEKPKVTLEQATVIQRIKDEDQPVAAIARATVPSRPTVYSVLGG